MGSSRIMTIRDAVHGGWIEYNDLRDFLEERGYGNWDYVCTTDAIRDYCCDMIQEGIKVGHIVAALEQDDTYVEDWKFDMCNSMRTPEPILDKVDLINALGLSDEELDKEYGYDDEEDEEDEDAD